MKIIKGSQEKYSECKKYKIGDFWGNGGGSTQNYFYLDDRIMKGIAIITDWCLHKCHISSTFRTYAYNEKLREMGYKSSPTSLHKVGRAIDFTFPEVVLFGTEILLHDAFRQVMQEKKIPSLYSQLRLLGIDEVIISDDPVYVHIGIKRAAGGGVVIKAEPSPGMKEVVTPKTDNQAYLKASREYYEYYFQDSSIKTIKEFIQEQNSPIKNYNENVSKFLNYTNADGVTNMQRIWELWTEEQKCNFNSQYKSLTEQINAANSLEKPGLIDKRKALYVVYSGSKDVPINVGTLLYIPKNKANLEVITAVGKDLFMRQQDLYAFQHQEFEALMNDPTYVKVQRTFMKQGEFTVNYLHLALSCWVYSKALGQIINISPFVKNMTTTSDRAGGSFTIELEDISDIHQLVDHYDGYINYLQKVTGKQFNISFFHKYISLNDIVWLRFEELSIERREEENKSLYLDKSELPTQKGRVKVYDMIGLVDTNAEGYNPEGNVANSMITGRDLNKLLEEDGCYFLPFALMNGGQDFFLNYNPQDTVFKRMFGSGDFMELFVATFRSIRDSLGFIFNQLTNIGILPENQYDLFSAYKSSYDISDKTVKDRTAKVYETNGKYPKDVAQNGIWQIVDMVVDHQLDDRRMQNGELSHPDGPILGIIQKVCQDPFVEFYGDTYGDKFVFVARQAPFTKDQIRDYFNRNEIVNITADIVGDVAFNWDERFYTWYQLTPLNGLYGSNDFVAGTMMPIVYFEEYAQAFGMHKRALGDNYLLSSIIKGDNEKSDVDLYRNMLAQDLKYVIESESILPFTRRGKIIIVGGDRRVKKNTWIYFEPTDEIFYVTGVSNNVFVGSDTLNRNTILYVERGMKRKYVLEDTYETILGKNRVVNYFDIVNMSVIVDSLSVKLAGDKVKITPLTANQQLVDGGLFEFFLDRRQM